jgi:hypothetical protein
MRETGVNMTKKTICENTDYTVGFKITRKNGMFIATKGKTTLQASSAAEIQELIKKTKKE